LYELIQMRRSLAIAILPAILFSVRAGSSASSDVHGFSIRMLHKEPSLEQQIHELATTRRIGQVPTNYRCCWGRNENSKPTNLALLTRPGESNIVAVILIEGNGTYTLNPPGFDYGPIPPLAKFGIETANQLWSSERLAIDKKNRIQKSYHLISSIRSVVTDFYVDAVFENQLLRQYRVRSEGNTNINPSWIIN
jgi:hypothetical protein